MFAPPINDPKRRRRLQHARLLTTTAIECLMLISAPQVVMAQTTLPQGGTVVSGQARIGAPSGNALSVVQNSSRTIIDWNSFSVGANGSVNFIQPNASAAVLNRVTGSTSSTIAGRVSGNGQVLLVNPNGIAITPTGSVQVGGGFVASTLDIGNADFSAGNLRFSGRGASAAVSNAGSIASAPGGFVALIGGSVSNAGTIQVPLGKVGLGSGEQATLNPTGDGFLQVAVPTGATAADGRALIDVAGGIRAAGGTVEIKAATAQQAVRDAVNISGALSARSASGRSGNIRLDGGSGGNVAVSGKLSAAGGKHHAGGTLEVTGKAVKLTSTARLNASGRSGGRILIGGDLRGGFDPSAKLVQGEVANAKTTVVERGAVINANGTNGAGGRAVIWSDLATEFRGSITATGAGTATGGAVEVSSHGWLGFDGRVDVTSARGKTGTLLLDPFDVTISSGTDNNMLPAGNTFSPIGSSSVLSVTTLQNALLSANITVNTGAFGGENGDITVANAVTWASGNSLTLTAARDVVVNAPISATGGGTLNLTGGRNIAVNSDIISSGGPLNVNLTASSSSGGVAISGATINTNGGNLIASATQSDTTTAITLNNATLNVGSGTGTLNGTSANGFGVVLSGTSSLSASTGAINVSGTSSSGTGFNLVFGTSITTSGAISLAGQSTSSDGINFSGGNTVTASGGNLALAGNSTSGRGLTLSNANTLTNNGVGSFSLTGTGSSNVGIFFNPNANLTTSGDMILSGTSASNVGTYFLSSHTISNSTGNLAINGTSTSNVGVWANNGAIALSNSGSGSFAVNGISSSLWGIGLNVNVGLASTGNVALSGTSGSNDGILLNGGNSLTDSAGNLTLAGTSTSRVGFRFNSGANSLTNSGAGAVSISGLSASGAGVELNSNASLTTSGNASLSGTSVTGTGMFFNTGSSTTSIAGNLAVSGRSTSAVGNGSTLGTRFAAASITNSGSGSLTITGQSDDAGAANSGSAGVLFTEAAALTNSGGGSLSVSGTNTSGYGLQLANASTLATSGTMSVSGTSSAGYGLHASNTSLTSAGALTLNGTSGSLIGTVFNGGVTLRDSIGDVTVNGTTSASNAGLQLRGTDTLTNSGAGRVSLNGSSTSGYGVEMSNSASLTTSGTTSISGNSSAGYGIIFNGPIGLTNSSGDLTMTGTSASGWGAFFGAGSSSLTNSSGTIALNGTSSSGIGVQLDTGANLATSGNITLSGASSSNIGTYVAGGNAVSASSGNLSLSGSSSSALGLRLEDTNAITNNGTGSLTLNAVGGADLGGTISSLGGTLVLSGSGNVNQSGGRIAAGRLLLSGASGNFILNASGNQIGTVAANAASLALTDGIALGIGTVQGVTGASTSGSLALVTAGDLTIGFGATVSGANPVLSAAGAFINRAGANSLTATSGRWLVYSNAPGTDSFGDLNSTNTALWHATYASLAPGSIFASGNRYLFAYQPILTVRSTDASKSFGTDLTAALAGHYTISGFQAGVANAFQGDTAATAYSGAATVTSAGAAPGANWSTGPYAINVGLGSLTSPANYAFTFENAGRLTVSPLPGSLFAASWPSSQGLSVKPPQSPNNSDALTGPTLAPDTSITTQPAGERASRPVARPSARAPASSVTSPVAPPAANPRSVPAGESAPGGAAAPIILPPAGSPEHAATDSSVVAEAACGGDNADGSRDRSSAETNAPCGAKARNSAGLIDFALRTLNRKALSAALDREMSDVRNAQNTTAATVIKAAAVASAALTAGLLGWLLRSGALLSALLSVLPLWQEFDPLMVVRQPRRRDTKQPPPTKLDRMFDDAQGLRRERREPIA